jgi:hypothetical protein
MSLSFPATIVEGMAISSNSINRPCFESPAGTCTDQVSWNIAIPLPHEECPQVSPSASHSEPGRDDVGVQQVEPDCQPLVTIQMTDINPYLVNGNPPQPVGDIKSNSSRWPTFTQCRNRSESMHRSRISWY